MGLSDAVARLAVRNAHALVVEVPGSWPTRIAAERAVAARGWRLAVSPADADVLVVCGVPGPRLAEAVEVVWHQMPGPRVRVDVHRYDEVAARLDEARTGLLDTDHHRHDARHRPVASDVLAEPAGEEDEGHGEHGGHGDMDHGDDADHEQMDHGGHEGMDHGDDAGHGGHGGHEGHGDMDMSPGGIPLAEGGEDRDGLEMDILNVRLGPVLPHWPAGLVLRCALQGDVIVEAQAELLDATGHQHAGPAEPARRLDNVASLLTLAGWDDTATEARKIRDAELETGEPAGPRLERLRRRVRRSWTLRWSLRGLRPLTEEGVHRHGLPTDAVGDTYDRLIRMLDRAAGAGGHAAAAADAGARTHNAGLTFSTDHLAHLVTGLDLATARLVVASLDVHGLRDDHVEDGVAHG